MSDIKIFVTHTPDKNTERPKNPLFYHVIAGSDFQTKPVPDEMYLDNQGDHISSRNKSYCELTTQYWAWKNQKADYYGFCHYRRFFSFSEKEIKETDWGTIEYDYLNEKAIQELCLNEKTMRARIEQYDFLISKGVKAETMRARTIYDHYKKAPDLRIEDVHLLLDIIEKKYSFLSSTAKEYFEGKLFYPCNMFIMKKELFDEYSAMLFHLLDEFEKRADLSEYSREGFRTTGHLGERILGIYYCWLQKQQKYRLGELQIALIHNTQADTPIKARTDSYTVPVVLAANQAYVPILYTCAQSIAEHTTEHYFYDIYIFHTDIQPADQANFHRYLEKENIRFTFVDVSRKVSGYKLQAKFHITTETFYRFLILDILKDYPKVIYLDADMIVCHDVAELFAVDLGGNLIAATADPDFAGQSNMQIYEPVSDKPDRMPMKIYCQKILGIENPFRYFQAGTLVLNVKELNKVTSVTKLFQMADTGIYRFSDQDILNIICKDRVLYLDMAWNMIFDCERFRWHNVIAHAPCYMLDEYEKARKNPYIIHYAGYLKPWMHPDEDFGEQFWTVARRTIYYERILTKMMNDYAWHITNGMVHSRAVRIPLKHRFMNRMRKIAAGILPNDNRMRRCAIRIYCKIMHC